MRGIVVTYWVSKSSPSATQTEQPAMKINKPKTKEGREPKRGIDCGCRISFKTFMSGAFLEMKRDAWSGIPKVFKFRLCLGKDLILDPPPSLG
jgi:hypothetical protein